MIIAIGIIIGIVLFERFLRMVFILDEGISKYKHERQTFWLDIMFPFYWAWLMLKDYSKKIEKHFDEKESND